MNLETERLIIRKLRESDLEDFYECRSDPQVCEFQGYEPITRENAAAFIAKLKEAQFGQAGEWIQLGVELKSENKIIGDIGLKPEAFETRIVEFGISFSTKYQGKGLAKEALRKIFSHLFAEREVHRVVGIMDVENARMIGLIENLKFRREGAYKQSFWDEGKNEWRDEYLYAMLASDWKTYLK
jgi:[ribosomal protein S5]-alanine N-acetyltransferase